MQPTGDLVRQLFSSVDPSRVEVFSCGHVIPKENLLPLCVSRWVLLGVCAGICSGRKEAENNLPAYFRNDVCKADLRFHIAMKKVFVQ